MTNFQKFQPFKEKESFYRDIFDATAEGLILYDPSTWLVVEANQTAFKMHGYRYEEFIGLPITELIRSDSQNLFTHHTNASETKIPFEASALHVRQDGSSFHVQWHGTPLLYEGHRYFLLSVRDVSQQIEEQNAIRKSMEERTQEQSKLLEISEAFASALEVKPGFILEQFRGIIEYTHAGLFAVEASSLIVLTTHNPEELEQAPPLNIQLDVPETLTSLFKKQRPIRIADVKGSDPAAEFLRSFLSDEAAAMLRGAQSWMWVPIAVKGRLIAVIGLAHSKPDYFKARHADMAMTLANQVAITLVNAELFEDAQAVAALQERQRLAHNLHDAVNQSLFSAGLIAEVLPRIMEKNPNDTLRPLEDLRKLIRGAIAEMRMLVAELRPLALTESNLSDLLHQLANAFTGRTNVPVAVIINGEDTLISEVQVAFYRICQEALNNIAKHAAARHVKINLQYTADKVEMHIQDDGHGFDPNLSLPGHYGLGMMHERAAAAGAKLEVLSQPGRGSEIILRWQSPQEQKNT